nr:hypothetical protein BaRGS_029986 [Batillaria attramentaria]
MGVYLAMIGAADAHYSGQYLWKREEWTGSGLCQAAGVLGLMASEVSAMIICLITIDRLIVLRFPLKFHLHMTARSALLASGVAWMLGVLLAVTPFAADWEFYSQTGICLPLPITQRDFPGQHYSFGVFIVLNFVLFCLIGVGQVIIYRAIRDTHKAAKTHCTKQDMAIARRLFLIVFTDFCCWFPVGVMGLLAANGTPIAGVVNVWTAIFILPLNSAINPFLYTINSLLERRRKRAEDKRVKMMMRKLNGLVNSWPLDKVNELYSHVSHVRRRLLEGRSPHHAGTQGQDYEMMSTCTDYTEHSEHSGYTAADSDPDRNTDYETVDLENNGEDERDSQSVQIFCVAPPSDERVATSPAM